MKSSSCGAPFVDDSEAVIINKPGQAREAGVGDRLQKVIPMVPIGRFGTAKECAEAILWLMCGEAAHMIRSILTLSGGR